MKKAYIFVAIFVLSLITIIITTLFFVSKLNGNVLLTGQVVINEKEYSYTKAICNETNFCQDYEITCKNKKVVSQSPITGAVIQHRKDWVDYRDKKELCG